MESLHNSLLIVSQTGYNILLTNSEAYFLPILFRVHLEYPALFFCFDGDSWLERELNGLEEGDFGFEGVGKRLEMAAEM